jgi:methylglutaconyl-CoA hydratase
MYQHLIVENKSQVLQVVLNRPEVKNAMNAQMIAELTEVFSGAMEDVRLLILKGAGDFFCAGGDLNWMKSSVDKTPQENQEDAKNLGRMIRALNECPVPVLTQVRGGAFGGGVGLVAASDIVLADERAKFSLSEVKLGLIPATIGPIVMRKIGVSQARRLYLTGSRFSALEAKQIGLVHEAIPGASILSVTNDYIREFESAGPEAVRRAKKLIFEMQAGSLWNEDISETTSQILSEVRVGPEAQEGVSAFLQKRAPSWKARLLP